MKLKVVIIFILIQLNPEIIKAGISDTLQHDGMSRTFYTHIPANYDGSNPRELIIALHGGFGSGEQLEGQSLLSEKSEEEGFIVVYPDGVPSLLGIRTWNGGGCCGYAVNNNIDDVGFINTLIDHMLQTYNIDSTRIYATGMSNGGFMCYRLACELNHRIAAIAPVACSMSVDACNPSRPLSIIHFHSYLDSNIPIEGGIGDGVSSHYNPPLDSVMNVWASYNNCQSADTPYTSVEYDHFRWYDGDCNSELNLYVSYDGGHSWPDGTSSIIGDPVSEVLSANDLMYAFFQDHTLQCTTEDIFHLDPATLPRLYPNPAGNRININVPQDWINPKILIYSTTGDLLLQRILRTPSLDLSGFNSGTYLLRITSDHHSYIEHLIIL
jgi:polyhydroxybutyrate depolymerase